MFKEQLKQYVENNPQLVSMKPVGDNIFVLKYRKKVFYKSLWNEFLEECRGTLVDKDFNIISYPFTKIYNYGIEKQCPVLNPDTIVNAYRKVNGFMVAVTWYNGDILISTTGSINSPFVDMARELIEPNLEKYRGTCKLFKDYTFLFECVHENDPHIIVEPIGMYFLAARKKEFGSEIRSAYDYFNPFGCFNVDHVQCSIKELQELVKSCNHEGYVAYTLDGLAFKIKSPYYLISKWLARSLSIEKIMDLNNDIKQKIDEEYYTLIDYIRLNIEMYSSMNEQDKLNFIRNFFI